VLKDVRCSLGVRGESLENRGESVVLVISLKMVDFSTCLFMHQFVDLDFQVIRIIARKELVPFNCTDVREDFEGGESFIINSCKFDHN
jgi:hypothetical protein